MNVAKRAPVTTNPHAPTLARYHQGPILTNGALEFVYEKPVTYPLITLKGPGQLIAKPFRIVAPQLGHYDLQTTDVSLQGAGVIAGGVEFQSLTEPGDYL